MRAKYQATSHAHGLSKTPEYRIWAGIKQRCFNPKRKEYERYGKAGITMHQPWVENFEEFYDHLGPRPSKTHSVDRIDNSLGYEPGNVRWATPEEQAQNSSIARPITLNGRTMTASEWSRELGVGFTTIIASPPMPTRWLAMRSVAALSGRLIARRSKSFATSAPSPTRTRSAKAFSSRPVRARRRFMMRSGRNQREHPMNCKR